MLFDVLPAFTCNKKVAVFLRWLKLLFYAIM